MVVSDSTAMKKAESRPFLKQPWAFQLRTLWLFTQSDIKTVIVPTTVFAFCCGFAETLEQSSANGSSIHDCLLGQMKRMPHVIIWTWTNLLVEVISNQRLPSAVLEDSINKPWRPLPSQRITPDESRRLLLRLVPLVFCLSWYTDTLQESAVFAICTWLYNDLAGSGESTGIRNALNAAGLSALFAGATSIAIRGSGVYTVSETAQMSSHMWTWLGLVAAAIFTTVQVQDLPDRAGDLLCRRETMPLVYGDAFTRWITATLILIWAFICPWFWAVGFMGYAVPVSIAVALAG
ncbi:MAG: hypothetical protein Q9203_005659, partial [Teloschistes exilis]